VLSTEQRVKIVEERMADHSQLFMEIRQSLLQFEERVDRRFEQVETRLTGLDRKVDGLGQTLGSELFALRRNMTAQFRWTASIMLTSLVAIVAAILSH